MYVEQNVERFGADEFTTLGINGIGTAVLSRNSYNPEVLTLVDFALEEHAWDEGFGPQLFFHVVQAARASRQTPRYLEAVVEDERLAECFAFFDDQALSFGEIDAEASDYSPFDTDIDEVTLLLGIARTMQKTNAPRRRPETVLIRAAL